jgi:3-oxoadipate enol-lactonase
MVEHFADGPESAPALVLSSSLGTTHAMWDPQVPAFAAGHRVLRYDRRGHGGSPLPPGRTTIDDLGRDVLDLLDELDVERASFCLSPAVSVGRPRCRRP